MKFYEDFKQGVGLANWNVALIPPRGGTLRKYLELGDCIQSTPNGLLFTTRPGDAVVQGDFERDKVRSEIGRYAMGEGQPGQTCEYRILCRFLTDFDPAPVKPFCMVTQWHVPSSLHDVFPRGWTVWLGPLQKNMLRFMYGLDSTRQKDFAVDFGGVCDISVKVRWETNVCGYAELFVNGSRIVKMRGPNLPSKCSMEWKFGIYRGHRVQSTERLLVEEVAVSYGAG